MAGRPSFQATVEARWRTMSDPIPELPPPNTPTNREQIRDYVNGLKEDLHERHVLELIDPALLANFCDRMSALSRWVQALPPYERPIDPTPLVSLVQGISVYATTKPGWGQQFPQLNETCS